MKTVYAFFKKSITLFKKSFFLAFFLSILFALLNVAVPLLLRRILTLIAQTNGLKDSLTLILLIAFTIIASIFVNIALYVSLDSFGGLFINHLESQIIVNLLDTDMREIDALGKEKIAHIMYSDVLEVFRTVGHRLPILISSCLISLCAICVVFFSSYKIALFLLISIVAGIIISMISRRIIFKASTETNNQLKGFYSAIQDFSETIQTIKVNYYCEYYKELFEERLISFIDKTKKEDKKIYLFSGFEKNFNIVMEIILSLILAIPSANNSITDYVFFVFVFTIVMNQGSIIEQLIQQIIRSKIWFDNVNELASSRKRSNPIINNLFSRIDISNMSFSYPGKNPCFTSYNAHFRSGDSVFLKGKNGSGKSTLLKLLIGLYSPDSGSIMIDGVRTDNISKTLLSKKVLYICQDESILNETALSYLKQSSKSEVSEDVIRKALAFVGFDDCNTPITQNGKSLSGGQQKKLLFAKLLINMDYCPVILIDELHAGMDTETKKKLNSVLNTICSSNSKILIVTSHEEQEHVAFKTSIVL